MSTIIKLRRDSGSAWASTSYILSEGEVGVEIESGSTPHAEILDFRIGDGYHSYANLKSWVPPISSVRVSGKTAVISSQTASVDLSDVYASSGSAIVSFSGSYNTGSGIATLTLRKASNSTITSRVSIVKVPTASKAEVASWIRGNTVDISGSYDASVDSAGWIMDDIVALMTDQASFQGIEAVMNSENPVVLYNSSYGDMETGLFLAGCACRAISAKRDGWGNEIAESYLHTNIDIPDTVQTVSGSIKVLEAISGSSIRGNALNIANRLQVNTSGHSGSLFMSGNMAVSGNLTVTGGISASSFSASSFRADTFNANSTITATGSIYTAQNVYAAGDVIGAYASDRRLKENIKPISTLNADAVLEALRPVEFEWNKKAEYLSEGHKTGTARGFIADEFLEILPNAGRKIWDSFDAIEYNQVIPYLVAGYQGLKKEVEDLKREIAELKKCQYTATYSRSLL